MLFKRWRRKRTKARAFPDAWRAILEWRMPLYRAMPEAKRRELEGHIQVFLAEKYIEGCVGLAVTEEMRVLIAAQASVLLMGRDTDYYPLMRTVLVYPGPWVGAGRTFGPAGMITEGKGWHRGESWHTPGSGGPVVLSWPDVVAGAADCCDGRNVAYHEFAHQLDAESGWVDGAPVLGAAAAAEWKRVMTAEFAAFRQQVWFGQPTVLDPYGAQNPAEFFAVATETFFERGSEMRAAHPELYRVMAGFFKQDPAACREGRCCRVA